jgi:hypothetical protein
MSPAGVRCKSTGNCGEQSDVAAYLAIKADATNRTTTYVVKVKPPGDHVFCIVGATPQPTWETVEDMKVAHWANVIVIDPWLNFACLARRYIYVAAAKMDIWLGKGKRIFWKGNNGQSPGWYQPEGDYLGRFLDSDLAYEKAD